MDSTNQTKDYIKNIHNNTMSVIENINTNTN